MASLGLKKLEPSSALKMVQNGMRNIHVHKLAPSFNKSYKLTAPVNPSIAIQNSDISKKPWYDKYIDICNHHLQLLPKPKATGFHSL